MKKRKIHFLVGQLLEKEKLVLPRQLPKKKKNSFFASNFVKEITYFLTNELSKKEKNLIFVKATFEKEVLRNLRKSALHF